VSAEVLRRAAAQMRERAGSVERSPWNADGLSVLGDARKVASVHNAGPDVADYIASWHPAVALAVADWLDYTAAQHPVVRRHVGNVTHGGPKQYAEVCARCWPNAPMDAPCEPALAALAVARAYLGVTP